MLVNATDSAEPFRLVPYKYQWAREIWKNSCANHWLADEVQLHEDADQVNAGKLSADETRLMHFILGYMSPAESLTVHNLNRVLLRLIQDSGVQMALLRQLFEEAVHVDSIAHVWETLRVPDEVYELHSRPSILAKDQMANEYMSAVLADGFNAVSVDNVRKLLRCLVMYYGILEGTWLYTNFAQSFGLRRAGKLVGLAENMHFICRDESQHLLLGFNIIDTIRREYPGAWDDAFTQGIRAMFSKAVKLEDAYVEDAMPNGIAGMGRAPFCEYVRFVADQRLHRLGISPLFGVTENPLPWLAESQDNMRETNFFERTVGEYQTSANLEW